MDDRYNRYHTLGNVTFYLDSYELNYEESCYLLLKVVEQAIRDYCFLEWVNIPYRKWHWETARDLIFDDNYFIQWGDLQLNLGRICEILAYTEKSFMDVDWIRRKTKERYEQERRKRESSSD
jgi:hypothetical protein